MKQEPPKLTAVLMKLKPDEVSKFALVTFTSKEHAAKALGLAVAKRLYEAQR
jgi:hypothetical protein